MPDLASLIYGEGQQAIAPTRQLSHVTNPVSTQTPGLDLTPPDSPETLNTRTQGWNGILESIKTDPTLQRTLLMMGARLMAGPQTLGESTGSIFGNALQTGVLTHQAGRAAEARALEARRTEDRASAVAQSQIESSKSLRQIQEEKAARDKELHPLEQRKRMVEADRAEFQASKQEELFNDSLATSKANRNKLNAQAERARRAAVGGTGGGLTKEESLIAQYKDAYPDETKAQILERVARHGKNAPADTTLRDRNTRMKQLNEALLVLDPKSPVYQELEGEYQKLLVGGEGEKAAAPVEKAAAPKSYDYNKYTAKQWQEFEKKADKDGVFLTPDGQRHRIKK